MKDIARSPQDLIDRNALLRSSELLLLYWIDEKESKRIDCNDSWNQSKRRKFQAADWFRAVPPNFDRFYSSGRE